MKKVFCDICGKPITNSNRSWSLNLIPNNDKISDFESIEKHCQLEDVCESCAKIIHYCVAMMENCEWKPDFHEVLHSDNVWTSDSAGYTLSEEKEIWGDY